MNLSGILQPAIDRLSKTSWWPEYQQLVAAGDNAGLEEFRIRAQSQYPDFVSSGGPDVVGGWIASTQERPSIPDWVGQAGALGGLGVMAAGAGAGLGALGTAETAGTVAPWGAGEAVSGSYAPTAAELGGASAANAGMDLGMYNPNQANPYVTGASGAGATAATNAAAGGAATGATVPAAAGTAISRILSGAGTAEDYLSVGGAVAPAALSAIGSYQQSQNLGNLANRYEGYGAPYRQNLADITNDPSKFYDSPAATKATDAILRRLSISGNPAGNPYSQALGVDALYKEYGAERDRQAGYGGLTQYNAAAPGLAAGAIGAQGAVYSDLGYGLGNVLAPKKTLAQQLAEYKAAGGSI